MDGGKEKKEKGENGKGRERDSYTISNFASNQLTLKIGMMSDSFSFLPLRGHIMSLGRINLSTHSMVTMSPLLIA